MFRYFAYLEEVAVRSLYNGSLDTRSRRFSLFCGWILMRNEFSCLSGRD